jgi:MFS family permease
MTRQHWFVLAMASVAWLFDCLDQQLFILARNDAMAALLPEGANTTYHGGLATSIFVAGWATGGLIFGALGDRFGRARMLTITVLMYSVCTGLSAFSVGFLDFAIYRFITGLGVGGVFGLAVALVADSLPDRARPHALGLLQALSAVGNIAAGFIALTLGWLTLRGSLSGDAWRILFLIGALPAFLCVFIQLRLKEPERWIQARQASKSSGVKFGSYSALLGDSRWRKRALLGMLMCVSAVIGLWGIGFFSPELIGSVIGQALHEEGVAAADMGGHKTIWKGITMILQNIGAFFGMIAFSKAASHFGRRPAFAVSYVCAMVSTIGVFRFLDERSDIFWMIPIMGFSQLALFAGFAIYLPELFPVSLRSTGTSFCYNVGRFIAASGPFVMGYLTAFFAEGVTSQEGKLDAFRDACGWLSCIFLLGLFVLPFMPETHGKPLPDDHPN